jgi:hypothetical protein
MDAAGPADAAGPDIVYVGRRQPRDDYLVLFTFLVPDAGGNYTELVEALSDNPDNVEQALHGVPPSTRPTVNCASTSSPAGADG